MYPNNEGVYIQRDGTKKDNSALGFVLFLPVMITIIAFMVTPLIQTLWKSLFENNIYGDSRFTGLSNYSNLFTSQIGKGLFNTIIIALISVPLTVGISLLFAWLSSRLHKVLRYVLSILFLIGSITAIVPVGLNWLIGSLGVNDELIFNAFTCRLIAALVPSMLGIGILYIIFSAYFLTGDNLIKYLHIAVSLQIVICFLSFFQLEFVYGFSFGNPYTVSLTENIYLNSVMQLRFGYSGAIAVLAFILLVLIFAVFNGIVMMIGFIHRAASGNMMKPTIEKQREIYPALSAFIFIIIAAVALILLYPFLITLVKSFGSSGNMTIKHYSDIFEIHNQGASIWTYLLNSLITLVEAAAFLFILSVFGSIGLTMIGREVKKLYPFLIVIFLLLSSTAILYLDRSSFKPSPLPEVVMKIIFRSAALVISVFISTKILETRSEKFKHPYEIMSSTRDVIKYLSGALASSALASLAAYFNPVYLPSDSKQFSLFMGYRSSANMLTAGRENSSFLVLIMIIPIVIVVIFTPILLSSFSATGEIPVSPAQYTGRYQN